MGKTDESTKKLALRLTGYTAAAGAFMALSPSASGQVEYSGLKNLELNLPEESVGIDMNGDTVDDFNFLIGGYTYFISSGPYYYNLELRYGGIINARTDTYNSWVVEMANLRTLTTYYGATQLYQAPVVTGMGPGEIVDSLRSSWANIDYMSWPGVLGFSYNVSYYGTGGLESSHISAGNFKGEERYIGVRFRIDTEQHFGWIRVNLGDEVDPVTIVDWGYETEPDVPVLTGDGLGIDLPAWLRITGGGGGSTEPARSLTIQATEEVIGMEESDIVVTNGNLSNFTEVTAGLEYSFDVTAIAQGTVRVEIPAGAVLDTADNANAAVSTSWEYDLEKPVAEMLYFPAGSISSSWASGLIRFNEKVFGFEQSDIHLKNATIYTFDPYSNGREFSLDISVLAEGEVSIEIPAGALSDIAGNLNDLVTYTWMVDATAPQATLEPGVVSTARATIEVDVTFDEPVTDLQLYDFEITNGTADDLETITEGLHYTLTVTAASPGVVIVNLAEFSVYDGAYNSNITASAGWMYDPTAIENEGEGTIRLFPNPVTDKLYINIAGESVIRVVDMAGNIVYLENHNGEEIIIDVNGFTPGVYIVQIQSSDKIRQYKFTVN